MNVRNKIVGHTTAFITVIFFAVNISATAYIFHDWVDAPAYTFIRTTGGLLVCWILSLFIKTDKIEWKKDWLIILLGGTLGLALFFFLFGYGISQTSPIDAAIILTLSPIITLVISAYVFKENITLIKSIGILLALGGALMMILLQGRSGRESAMLGNILVFLGAFIYSVYLISTRNVSRKYNPVQLLRWMFLAAFLVSIPVGLPDFLSSNLMRNLEATPIEVAAFIAIFPSALAYVLIPVSLKSLTSTTVSMYLYLVPILASILSISIGQAVLRWYDPIALVMVIGGVFLSSRTKKKKVITDET